MFRLSRDKLAHMDEVIAQFLAELRELPDFCGAGPSDVNACAVDDDTVLHFAVRRRDVTIVKALIDAGANVNRAGDLGYTPLHVACMQGDLEITKLMVASGADLFSLSEGYPPFTTAQRAKQDQICAFLGPLMEQQQSADPKIWTRARIKQLRREIATLEAKLNGRFSPSPRRAGRFSSGHSDISAKHDRYLAEDFGR